MRTVGASLAILWMAISYTSYGQQDSSYTQVKKGNLIFSLGEVTVLAAKSDSSLHITAATMAKFNRTEVSHALNLLSGVTLANIGPRNESVVFVRGFDLRQVPVFLDGVPVYVPYDGYVDMGRFTTFDLAQIQVSKGFSSLLYGANNMGGAINLISRRPTNRLDLDARVGVFSGNGRQWNLNVGTASERYYLQLGISQITQEHFPLSGNYALKEQTVEGRRDNSYRNDFRASAKIGFTPNQTDEYAIGYALLRGEKGTPPYVGADSRIMTRYWRWPNWDKESLYLISKTAITSSTQLKSRIYYDTFDNSLFSFDDATYTTQNRPFAFQSYYDDYTVGANLETVTSLSEKLTMNLGGHLKRDVHRENNLGEPQSVFSDNTYSIALETPYAITPALSIVPGLAFNSRASTEAKNFDRQNDSFMFFPNKSNQALNAQIGFFAQLANGHSLDASISRRTRFATIKDRYSFRLGSAIPNPSLHAEHAVNYDLTYSGSIASSFSFSTSLFRSDIADIIQRVDDVEPGLFQLQNAGKARFMGLEANLTQKLTQQIQIGANYTYLSRRNITSPEIRFTDVPTNKILLFGDITFQRKWNLLTNMEYNSRRYSTSYGATADAFALVNTRMAYQLSGAISIEGGVNNLLDSHYALVEGFPEPGRNFFLNLAFTMNKE
ncbi:TonB-dependent receptor plug domain-containing protein [Lunatimonas salinarum]|uniref:TonB-dependent receptor plug domain-containing protein n=1 Tax=Lunatimonas salinarum TaxID=1774590 RepID=UPI001ADF167D|nr:TonB-dependent receptor [Lunatimonas salinarum]